MFVFNPYQAQDFKSNLNPIQIWQDTIGRTGYPSNSIESPLLVLNDRTLLATINTPLLSYRYR